MVELSSHPNTKFGPSWQYPEPFAYISYIPSLQIEIVDCIYSFWRKSRLKIITSRIRINCLLYASVVISNRLVNFKPVSADTSSLTLRNFLLGKFLLMMNFEILVFI